MTAHAELLGCLCLIVFPLLNAGVTYRLAAEGRCTEAMTASALITFITVLIIAISC